MSNIVESWSHYKHPKLESAQLLNTIYKRNERGVNSKHYLVMTAEAGNLLIPSYQLGGITLKNGDVFSVETNHLGKQNYEFFAYKLNTKPTTKRGK